MPSVHQRLKDDWMTRNRAGVLYGIAFLVTAALMAGWHWLLTGINADFGAGAVVGAFVGYGVLSLASRRVRESD